MNNLEIFSARLNELTKENGMTAFALTKKLDIPHSTAWAWYAGKSFPSVEYLIKLAKFFDCSTDFLLGLKEY